MIDLHVTPDEFRQLQDAIDQVTRTAMALTHQSAHLSVVASVLGDDVAQSIAYQQARLVIHYDGTPIQQRIKEAL